MQTVSRCYHCRLPLPVCLDTALPFRYDIRTRFNQFSQGRTMSLAFSYAHLFAAAIFISLGAIVLFKDLTALLNRICAALFSCFFIWSFSYAFVHNPLVAKETAVFFENIGSLGWVSFGGFFLWFAVSYTQKQRLTANPFFILLLFSFPLFIEVRQWSGNTLFSDHVMTYFGWQGVWNDSFWPYLFFSYYLLASGFSLLLIFRYGKKSGIPVIKRQASLIIVGTLFPLLSGTITNVALIKMHTFALPSIADIFILFWAGCMAFAMMRYRLLSITPAIAAEQIVSAMKDLLLLLDQRGTITYLNEAALDMLGYDRNELKGKRIGTIIAGTEEERSRLNAIILRTPKSEFETSFESKNGNVIPVNLATSILPDAGIVCIAHNIAMVQKVHDMLSSEIVSADKEIKKTSDLLSREIAGHEQTQQALEESEQRFKMLFEFAPDGFYLSDLQGIFIEGNREAERITGYRKKELIGKSFLSLKLLPLTQIPLAVKLLAKNALGQPTGPDEFVLNRKNGTKIPVEISTFPIQINNRRVVLGIARNISQRRKAEEEKQQLKENLHQAQKMEAVGRLAGGIAHDFNNLLAVISGYAELLHIELTGSSPAEAKIAKKIADTVQNTANLTKQLLAFSRKGKYQVTAVNLHKAVDEAIALLNRSIDKRITITAHLRAQPSTVMGDLSQLQNAMLNLGLNARDAMPDGGTITFETECVTIDETPPAGTARPGAYIRLSVTDTGVGMDEETRARAFEPFFTTKEKGKGTGLGLASVYGTVMNHNGLVELQSEPGRGTTVVLYLPVADQPAASEPEATAPAEPTEKRSGRILVVEDEGLVREMICDALASLGYSATSCTNGKEAVTHYRSHFRDIDCVLLDLTMPELNGADCFRAMKAINPEIKAVITSGYTMDEEINKLLQEGAFSFIQKPFTIHNLSDILNKALR